jgi:hypothetical protein
LVQRVLLKLLSRIENWIFERNITKRRIKHAPKPYVILAVCGGLAILALILLISYWLAVARSIVQYFLWLGAQLGMSSEFATIIVAELIAFVIGTVVVRIFTRSPKVLVPDITMWPKVLPRTDEHGVRSYTVRVSNEEGQTSAIDCEARIVLDDIDKREIIDLHGARLTSNNFAPSIKADLLWDDGKKQRTLRSGDDAVIVVLKHVPASGGIEAHFEVPSGDDSWRSTVCLRLGKRTLYPKLRIVPLNGKYAIQELELRFDSSAKDWVLDFGPS